MNILHLKYAVEIAKTQSISKAAENLYMGQPNLSRAIRELEESLGITIFNRTSKGISITTDGEEFLQYARRIIAQIDEVEELYRSGRKEKQSFSIAAPRASYISAALVEFAKTLRTDIPSEIFYKETNASRTLKLLTNGDCNLGIVRYLSTFDSHFRELFKEKNFVAETVTDFSYLLLVSRESPLAAKDEVTLSDLQDYIEISHSDPYVPSVQPTDIRKAELSQRTSGHIYVFERASQFDLLEKVPTTFMWVSAIPQSLCDKYGLVQRVCRENQRVYKDVLVHHKNYHFTPLDQAFLTALTDAKRRYIEPFADDFFKP